MRISDWSSDVCSSDLLLKREDVRDHRVNLNPAVHVPIDDLGDVGATLRAAKCGPTPIEAGDELERARGDFLARFGNSDDDARITAAMAGFERLAHYGRVAGAVESIVSAPVGQDRKSGGEGKRG